MSAIINIISDWQKNDYYLGIVKAKILSACPNTTIVDINNSVPYSTTAAGFLLKNSYKNFPEGSIHIIAINTCESEEKNEKAILIKFDGHFFICNDNAVMTSVISDGNEKYEAYKIIHNKKNSTFPEKDIFAETAIKILKNIPIEEIAKKIDEIKIFVKKKPIIDKKQIIGNIIYFDTYGNAITNITKEIFEKYVIGNFTIQLEHPDIATKEISKNYNEKSIGSLIAIFNSFNLLEICIRNDNIAKRYSLNLNSPVIIDFDYEQSLF